MNRRTPKMFEVQHEVGELPPPEFGSDYLVEDFTELASELLGVTTPHLFDTGPRTIHLRAFAAARTVKRLGSGKPPLRRDLDRLPGGALLAYADALEKTVHGAVNCLVATLLRQSAIMLAQDYLGREGLL